MINVGTALRSWNKRRKRIIDILIHLRLCGTWCVITVPSAMSLVQLPRMNNALPGRKKNDVHSVEYTEIMKASRFWGGNGIRPFMTWPDSERRLDSDDPFLNSTQRLERITWGNPMGISCITGPVAENAESTRSPHPYPMPVGSCKR